MIRVHQKQKATNSSTKETKKAIKAINSSEENNQCEARTTRSACALSALRILQSGANSSFMLREKLRRKGYSQSDIDDALKEVTDAGLLDDKRLLIAHAAFLATRKYYGKRRVYLELAKKFDRETVAAYFEEAVEEIDFSSCCLAFAEKNADKRQDALAAKLSRQGYTTGEIRLALSSVRKDIDT